MIYNYKLYETSQHNDVYIESGKEKIKTLFNKIEDHSSKIVNNFNDRWERNNTDKIINHLKKSKNIKIKIAPGIAERVKNYIGLKDQYKKTILNPSEENAKKLNDAVEKSKKKRKRIIFGATVTVSVSSIIAYLLLLKHRNTTSDFTLNDIKKNIPDEIFNTNTDSKERNDIKKNIPDEIFNMNTELENLKTSYSKEQDERNSYYTKMRKKIEKENDEWNNNIDKFKSLWDTLKASKNASNELEASQKELYDEMMNALRNSSENLQNIHDINMTVMNIN